MTSTLMTRGFLPDTDPLEQASDSDFRGIEQLGRELPDLVDQGRFREQFCSTDEAGLFPKGFNWTSFIEASNPRSVEAVFRLYCYLASAWVHASRRRPVGSDNVIHSSITRPLVRLAKHLGQPPILAYRSYCLNNWKRLDPTQPIELGNIALIQNFTNEAKRDEDWFILVHVDIEARAVDAIQALKTLGKVGPFGWEQMSKSLDQLYTSLVAINKTMDRMPEACSPDVYYNKVRPYIFGFANIIYDRCFDNEPQTYRGETGAQSTIVPAVIAGLGIRHKESMLTKHLNDMKLYMPPAHRDFLEDCEEVGTQTRRWIENTKSLHEKYNACVEQIIKFRQTHFDYAIQYIQKRVENPTGTGGTPYVKWLGELVEETKSYLM